MRCMLVLIIVMNSKSYPQLLACHPLVNVYVTVGDRKCEKPEDITSHEGSPVTNYLLTSPADSENKGQNNQLMKTTFQPFKFEQVRL